MTIKNYVQDMIRERSTDAQLRFVANLLEKEGFNDWKEVVFAYVIDHPDNTLPISPDNLTKDQAGSIISWVKKARASGKRLSDVLDRRIALTTDGRTPSEMLLKATSILSLDAVVNTHVNYVTVFARAEDEEEKVLRINTQTGEVEVNPDVPFENPSDRRDGIVVEMWDEQGLPALQDDMVVEMTDEQRYNPSTCRHALAIYQHKGHTFAGWIQINGEWLSVPFAVEG